MRSTIDKFKDVHFYRFGRPVRGDNDSSCHMAWRYRPKGGKAAAFYKDYRTFTVVRFENCTVSLIGMGEYHSGGNARKRKAKGKGKKVGAKVEGDSLALPMVGENVDDALPLVESEDSFSRGKYLIYAGGAFVCLRYTLRRVDEEGKDFRFYFDFEHLKDSALVLDQAQFWSEWSKWQRKDGLNLHLWRFDANEAS
ncbi:UNVERIFIED_CONTAM: hypothetical protein Sradi_5264300 [Sesamum radiatum]|uniref:Uncharacterized protein n=1 Tax=Sesamum radiatum TaxID=300843 RepID=A0AAW2LLX8_SESRA